ncbi:lipid II:glycine glycyltransferase FemX [Planococcus koreensis]|uniref:lipid II:glycine glycyltransferase FemX n=1 Tax=Planococcus koreensis TaxID=112331 RepID=UPI0039FDD186
MQVQETRLLTVIDGTDNVRWNSLLAGFSNTDIYFSHEYFMSALLLDEGEAMLFVFENADGKIAYPVIKRTIANESDLELYDITTPYGYGGPLISCSGNEQALLAEFRKEFGAYCQRHHIVSEFARFHPLLGNQQGFENDMQISHVSDTVAIDLQQDGDLLSRIPGKNRNMIRKAMKNNIEIKEISSEDYLEEFILMYYDTMRRNNATRYYFFTEDYFRKTIRLFGPDLHFFGAFLEGKMIAATLVLSHGKFIHYHLSGSLTQYRNLGANNLLLFKIAEWGQERGAEAFHLGGGYSGQDDSLYRFKKTFTQDAPLAFHIGKKIHNPALYQMLCFEKQKDESSAYFPLYRA